MGRKGRANLLIVLYEVVWIKESISEHRRQGLIISFYRKGDAEDPGNYRGITLLNVVGKLFCKIPINCLVSRLESCVLRLMLSGNHSHYYMWMSTFLGLDGEKSDIGQGWNRVVRSKSPILFSIFTPCIMRQG